MQCSKYILICIWKHLNSLFDNLNKRAKTFLFYVGPHPHMRFGHLQMLRNPWSRFDINACYYSGLIAQQARPAGVIMKTGPQSPLRPSPAVTSAANGRSATAAPDQSEVGA